MPKMAGHWLGVADNYYRPFKPLSEHLSFNIQKQISDSAFSFDILIWLV